MPSGARAKPGAFEQAVADTFRTVMQARGLTIAAVADAAGISRPQLSKILNHVDNKALTLVQTRNLCDALGLDMLTVIADASRRD